jgi:hypothetical protein
LKNSFSLSRNLFQENVAGLYGPLTEGQLPWLSPGHEDGGAFLECPATVLDALGLPSHFVPFKPYLQHGPGSAPYGCNTCGCINLTSTEQCLKIHLASPEHVAKTEEACARPDFSPAAVTGKERRLDFVGYVRPLVVHLRNHFPPTHHLSSFLLPLTIRYSVLRISCRPTSLVM